MRTRAALLALLLAASSAATHAEAAAWPTRPVRMIVPFAPGGGTDIIARMLAPRLSQEFGQHFVVDNRGGAGGTIGAEMLVRADPDGHTIGFVASTYATAPALYQLPYDPVQGVAPVSMTNFGPFVLAVHPSVKAADLHEFIALARAKPGALNYGSSGTGGTMHLAGELFAQMTKTRLVHVAYKGTGPAVIDLIGGQIQFIFANGPSVLPHVKTGKLRALAVTTERRAPFLPELPAVNEAVPGFVAISWHGMLAPAGTPRAVIARLHEALGRILQQPEVQEILQRQGLVVARSTPEEFAKIIAQDVARWSKVVQAGKIRTE